MGPRTHMAFFSMAYKWGGDPITTYVRPGMIDSKCSLLKLGLRGSVFAGCSIHPLGILAHRN